MQAGKLDLRMEQSATFSRILTILDSESIPIDISNCTAIMHIREEIDSSSVYHELSTSNSHILILDGPNGSLGLEIPAATTDSFTWSTGVYDLLLTFPDGIVRRLVEGAVIVSPSVTRAN